MVSLRYVRETCDHDMRMQRLQSARRTAAALSIERARDYQRQKVQQDRQVQVALQQQCDAQRRSEWEAIQNILTHVEQHRGMAMREAAALRRRMCAEARAEQQAWQAEHTLQQSRSRLAWASQRVEAQAREEPHRRARRRRSAVAATERARSASVCASPRLPPPPPTGPTVERRLLGTGNVTLSYVSTHKDTRAANRERDERRGGDADGEEGVRADVAAKGAGVHREPHCREEEDGLHEVTVCTYDPDVVQHVDEVQTFSLHAGRGDVQNDGDDERGSLDQSSSGQCQAGTPRKEQVATTTATTNDNDGNNTVECNDSYADKQEDCMKDTHHNPQGHVEQSHTVAVDAATTEVHPQSTSAAPHVNHTWARLTRQADEDLVQLFVRPTELLRDESGVTDVLLQPVRVESLLARPAKWALSQLRLAVRPLSVSRVTGGEEEICEETISAPEPSAESEASRGRDDAHVHRQREGERRRRRHTAETHTPPRVGPFETHTATPPQRNNDDNNDNNVNDDNSYITTMHKSTRIDALATTDTTPTPTRPIPTRKQASPLHSGPHIPRAVDEAHVMQTSSPLRNSSLPMRDTTANDASDLSQHDKAASTCLPRLSPTTRPRAHNAHDDDAFDRLHSELHTPTTGRGGERCGHVSRSPESNTPGRFDVELSALTGVTNVSLSSASRSPTNSAMTTTATTRTTSSSSVGSDDEDDEKKQHESDTLRDDVDTEGESGVSMSSSSSSSTWSAKDSVLSSFSGTTDSSAMTGETWSDETFSSYTSVSSRGSHVKPEMTAEQLKIALIRLRTRIRLAQI